MMTRRPVLIGAAIVVLGVAVWYLFVRQGEPPVFADLVQQFPQAVKKSTLPLDRAFEVDDVTIDGETKRSIVARSISRLYFSIRPPEDAWLTVSLALDPKVWTLDGDGVQFRVGVSDGRSYDELLKQHVDPRHVEGDRRWIPVTIDLSPYADRQVDLIFNTDASAQGARGTPDHDESLWGAPRSTIGR